MPRDTRTPMAGLAAEYQDRLHKDLKRERKKAMDQNPVIGGAVLTSAGGVYLTIDHSAAVFQMKGSDEVFKKVSQLLLGSMFMTTFRALVLKTPVHRGTARLNWKVSIGRRTATYKGMSGSSDKYMNVEDPGLSPAANKLGMLKKGNSFQRASSSAGVLVGSTSEAGEKIDVRVGSKMEDGKKVGIFQQYRGVLTQREFGKKTPAIDRLFSAAENLIRDEWGPKKAGDSRFSPKLKPIKITNTTPYLKFLEGTGKFGAVYGGGSMVYQEKVGSNTRLGREEDDETDFVNYSGTFVRMLEESKHSSNFSYYEAGFIASAYRKLLSSLREETGRRADRRANRRRSKPMDADGNVIRKWMGGTVTHASPHDSHSREYKKAYNRFYTRLYRRKYTDEERAAHRERKKQAWAARQIRKELKRMMAVEKAGQHVRSLGVEDELSQEFKDKVREVLDNEKVLKKLEREARQHIAKKESDRVKGVKKRASDKKQEENFRRRKEFLAGASIKSENRKKAGRKKGSKDSYKRSRKKGLIYTKKVEVVETVVKYDKPKATGKKRSRKKTPTEKKTTPTQSAKNKKKNNIKVDSNGNILLGKRKKK